jgi:predicted aspartyl protease
MLVQVLLNDHVQAPFLVDTGASGISIPHDVARRLGERLDADTPRISVQTAAGIVGIPIPDSVVGGGASRADGAVKVDGGGASCTFFNNFVYQSTAAG